MNVLILGNGLLGSELNFQSNWNIISREKDNFDISKYELYDNFLKNYDTIINCIAHTDTYSVDKTLHWNVNYKAVISLSDYCSINNIKLVHISSDYIYSNSISNASEDDVPIHGNNWYSYTKLIADAYVQAKLKNYLIIRTSHKPYPFPYKFAWDNQLTNGDYVNVIVSLIIKLINKNAIGVYNVGTDIKTWFDLTQDEFDTIPIISDVQAPSDVTMNVSKIRKFLNE